MGQDINVHDQWEVESMGEIQDRTQENLGTTDVGIMRYRRMLRRAIRQVQNGEEDGLPMQGIDPAAITGPVSIDAIGSLDEGWEAVWRKGDRDRRAGCSWITAGEPDAA